MTKLINESVSFLYEILFANWHFEVAKYFKMAYLTVSSQREIISAKIWENFNWGDIRKRCLGIHENETNYETDLLLRSLSYTS